MRLRRLPAVLPLLVAVAALAQAPTTPALNDFAGTWTAEFHKQVWMKLTLSPENGTLSGTLEHSEQISVDNEGDITKVDEDMTTDKLVGAELQGGALYIQTKDTDGDANRYQLTLTAKDAIELRAVTADGNTAPKPFKLKRAVTAQK